MTDKQHWISEKFGTNTEPSSEPTLKSSARVTTDKENSSGRKTFWDKRTGTQIVSALALFMIPSEFLEVK